MFSTTFWVLQKWSCNFHSKCKNTLLSLINSLLRFITLDNGGTIGQKLCFIGKFKSLPLFFILCFQQPLRCYRNDLSTPIVVVRTPCWASQIVSWGLSHSIMGEKIGQKLFSLEIMHFFSKVCVFNNLVGVTEMIL